MPEIVIAAAIFSDIGTGEVHHRIEQSNGFGQYSRNVLPPLFRHLAKTGVGICIDLKRTIDQVHGKESNIYRRCVEASRTPHFAAGDIAGGTEGGPLAGGSL